MRRVKPFSVVLVFSFLMGGAAFAQAPAAKVDPKRGAEIAQQVCVACHGADGNSPTPANPKIAGQHAAYLYHQLVAFKPAAEGKEALRPSPIMSPFAAQLSEQDMRNVAAYFASQPLKPATAGNKELVELGQRIYRAGIPTKGVPACAGCHSPNGAGLPDQYPRLHGQFAEYTEAQLVAFRQGVRKNNAVMTGVASPMSDREIKAVADYIAGLR